MVPPRLLDSQQLGAERGRLLGQRHAAKRVGGAFPVPSHLRVEGDSCRGSRCPTPKRPGLNKEIAEAILRQKARQPDVWTLLRSGHKAALVCDAGCCRFPIGGSVRNSGRAARDIARKMARHPLDEGDPRAGTPRGSTD